ncbi:hypothetical protein TcCL_ESM03834 [Trypanosoma cruzi]|nr:hypothetical protein TcCL_ESM03834 [Trypanosoma cruzi]
MQQRLQCLIRRGYEPLGATHHEEIQHGTLQLLFNAGLHLSQRFSRVAVHVWKRLCDARLGCKAQGNLLGRRTLRHGWAGQTIERQRLTKGGVVTSTASVPTSTAAPSGLNGGITE